MFQKLENDSICGYKLHDFGSHWELHWSKGIFKGNMRQVCVFAVMELGFSIKELEIGILEMENNFHNAAEYGIFKKFMWTFDRETNQSLAC